MDIVCVSETWLSDEIPDPPLLNYVLYRRDRTYTSGSGVAVYVNCKIGSCRLDTPDLDGISESLWVQLRPTRLPRGISSILLGIIYHPPSASAEDNEKLYEHVKTMVDSYTLRHLGHFQIEITKYIIAKKNALTILQSLMGKANREKGHYTS